MRVMSEQTVSSVAVLTRTTEMTAALPSLAPVRPFLLLRGCCLPVTQAVSGRGVRSPGHRAVHLPRS